MDITLRNTGESFYLRPDSLRLVKLWINNFDLNGVNDIVVTRTYDNKDVPVVLKLEIQSQIPSIKKENLKHADYAKKTIQELFPEDLMNKSVKRMFNYCSSIVALNNGNGQFKIEKLPRRVQFSSLNAIEYYDINRDSYKDIIIGGNEFGFLPQFGRLNGSFGDVLINDRKGGFYCVQQKQTGIKFQGQVRDIASVQVNSDDYFIFSFRIMSIHLYIKQRLSNKMILK
jgi:hypothetical protein